MRPFFSHQALSTLATTISFLLLPSLKAQWITNVATADELAAAFAQAFSNSVADSSAVNTITLTGNISASSQMIVDANVNIVGNGHTIDMNNADRAFFIAGGAVSINNLSIANGQVRGGSGSGGGGGAGLGGAIFVGSGTYYGGADPLTGIAPVAALGISAPVVTLSGVSFSSNSALGGIAPTTQDSQGGGGGMGGVGGIDANPENGMGGGGFGNNANGAANFSSSIVQAGSGAMINVIVPTNATTSGGPGGNGSDSNGSPGGTNGGGGGAGGTGYEASGSGGGGGVGGGRGYYANGANPSGGGNGGFGGGGGGAATAHGQGGNGGFGGGGGNSSADSGGTGGFGGGGGGYFGSGGPGPGGFGAGRGSYMQNDSPGSGGGGLGAGGALFVMAGATLTVQDGNFASNSVRAGQGYVSGSAYGADLFLGADVTFNVFTNLTLNSLGGAGNTNDPNIVNNYGVNYANDPNAQGGIIKTGTGNLTLTGTNYYSGNTTVKAGTLTLAPGAKEIGTKIVTIGQNNGDNATLVLGSSSEIVLGGFNGGGGTDAPIMIAQSAGSTGTLVIGNGAGSSGAFVGARTFTGGAGDASVQFTQQYAAGSTNDTVYAFYTTITGSARVVQSGPGTTALIPLYGANTFTGGVLVNQGRLQLGSASALPSGNDITLNGGAFDLNGFSATAAVLTLNGGTITNSGGNQAITPNSTVAASGTIAASIGGTGGLTQQGAGTTTITSATAFTGATAVNQGTLVAGVSGALGGTTNVTVATGGTLALGASNSVHSVASLVLNGGTLKTAANLSQVLGAWTLLNSSTLDFGGYAATLTFSSLSINGTLSIWNWNAATDAIFINGASDAYYSDITFYSDSGTTVLGTGAIRNGQLEAVPEPSTWALLGLGAVAVAVIAGRRKSLQS